MIDFCGRTEMRVLVALVAVVFDADADIGVGCCTSIMVETKSS